MLANMLLLQSPVTTRSVLYHSPFRNIPQNGSNNSNLRYNRLRCRSSASQPISTCSPLRTKSASPTIDDDLKQLNDAYNESLMMPKHVALIVDGHRRWARDRGVPLHYGYHAGLMVNLRQLILSCLRLDGIQVFTVYVFSCKNWTRSKEEVEGLMIIFESLIQYQIREMIKEHNLRFSVIGDKSKLPKSLKNAISSAEESSKGNRGMHLVMALSYSGRYEITEAVKEISRKIEHGTLRARDVDESMIEHHLYMSETTDTPCPDLLIRTGGESRLSGFMLWQMPYTELYFSGKLFPEFNESDLIEALRCFKKRERRFGK